MGRQPEQPEPAGRARSAYPFLETSSAGRSRPCPMGIDNGPRIFIYTVMNAPLLPTCPKCGLTLPVDAPKGLCPGCLAAMNFATETVFTGADALAAQPPLLPAELAPHFPQLE